MACEMETVLPSFVLVMAMPMLDCPFVRVIEVEGASVCSTVAISPNVIGVGIAAEVCIPEGKDEGLLVPDVVDVGKVAVPVAPVVVDVDGLDTPTTRCLRSSREVKELPTCTGNVCPFEVI